MSLVNDAAATETTETLEQRFRRLDAIWRKETAYQSSSKKIKKHPAFREVVALGDAVIPLLLRELQGNATLWVWALPEITGANPVPQEDQGNISKMTEDWLRWAKDQGLRW
jgi:hypothetical protein